MPINQSLEEQFRERFEHLEEVPPALAWNQIRKEIAPVAAPEISKRRFEWLAPGAIMAVISVFLLFLLKYNKALDQQPTATVKEQALLLEEDRIPASVTAVQTMPAVPKTVAPTPVKSAIKATAPASEKVARPVTSLPEKRYAASPKKSVSTLAKAAEMPKIQATKVVYEITVDPQSASVKKIATAVPDSVAAN